MADRLAVISIHALREEGDMMGLLIHPRCLKFLSTPSARRATRARLPICKCWQHFYPRPPRGGRPGPAPHHRQPKNFYPRPPRGGRRRTYRAFGMKVRISIHALREEGDLCKLPPRKRSNQFLSTPSARRATKGHGQKRDHPQISIHALREEGDESLQAGA